MYQMTINGPKIEQMEIKFTNIFHCKIIQNLPNFFIYHLATLTRFEPLFHLCTDVGFSLGTESVVRNRPEPSGTDVVVFRKVSPNKLEKKMALSTQIIATFSLKNDHSIGILKKLCRFVLRIIAKIAQNS
jgi:hypothetical protein